MRCTAKVFEEVSAPFDTLWEDRVVLGCWAVCFTFKGLPSLQLTGETTGELYSSVRGLLSRLPSGPYWILSPIFESIPSD